MKESMKVIKQTRKTTDVKRRAQIKMSTQWHFITGGVVALRSSFSQFDLNLRECDFVASRWLLLRSITVVIFLRVCDCLRFARKIHVSFSPKGILSFASTLLSCNLFRENYYTLVREATLTIELATCRSAYSLRFSHENAMFAWST